MRPGSILMDALRAVGIIRRAVGVQPERELLAGTHWAFQCYTATSIVETLAGVP